MGATLGRIAVVVALLVAFFGCAGSQGDPAVMAPTGAPSPEPTETPGIVRKCPADRESAGTEYLFDKAEMTAAEATERFCGPRSPVTTVCPDVYANSGEEFSYSPDEYSPREAQIQNCTVWTAYTGQSDGQVVLAADSIHRYGDAWTLAIWCANDNLYVLATRSEGNSPIMNNLGTYPVSYQFGDWENFEDMEAVGYKMALDYEAKAEEEYQQDREFQPMSEEDSPETDVEYTEAFWIVETAVFDHSEPKTVRYRNAYREFASKWGSYGWVGISRQDVQNFVGGIRNHRVVAFVLAGFHNIAFSLTGAERDVEPVLQECGY